MLLANTSQKIVPPIGNLLGLKRVAFAGQKHIRIVLWLNPPASQRGSSLGGHCFGTRCCPVTRLWGVRSRVPSQGSNCRC
jgi:hypothetical protein